MRYIWFLRSIKQKTRLTFFSPTMSSTRSSAPQLVFDDGSRVLREYAADDDVLPACPRGEASLVDFYQLEALVKSFATCASSQTDAFPSVALQFPDDLLQDAPDVCQYLQDALPDCLVFVLGDTTFAPCCSDTIAAKHLHASVLIHFGHACLSRQAITTSQSDNVTEETKILYCFGNYQIDVHDCVEQVTNHIQQTNTPRRLLLLYDTSYHHVIEELQTRLGEQGDLLVIAGDAKLPEHIRVANDDACSRLDSCCASSSTSAEAACSREGKELNAATSIDDEKREVDQSASSEDKGESDGCEVEDVLLVGGLQLPAGLDIATFTVLYIGDPNSRQFLNIAMRLLSDDPQPLQFWSYHPGRKGLETSLDPSFARKLNRRFYLVNKAKQVSVFGLLVASLADPLMQRAVSQLQRVIDACGRSSYTVCVGKINPAKLANFAEIECYVLLACPEHSLLDDESDFSTIVLTPFELLMSLGIIHWGDRPYSMRIEECLPIIEDYLRSENGGGLLQNDDSDEPYFNVATGRFELAPARKDDGIDLQALPGKGQLTAYKSVAAQFLKQRDYQGLQVKPGETEIQAAILGQQGIPSNYGDR
jgi:diphthamide biosynthesis protein 2